MRIVHEAQLYESNWFATFTYRDEDLPESRSLEYDDFQRMMKRLRKRIRGQVPGPKGNYPLRFFCAGEYGSKRKRPHYHAILFNLRVGDEKRYENGSYYSKLLEDLWQKGTVQLEAVTEASAAYVSGYALKKVYGTTDAYEDVVDLKTGELTSRRKEFVTMSRRPGIGAWWYEKFGSDLFPRDVAVMRGKRHKVPRYYWERFKLESDPRLVEELENERYLRAAEQVGESTPERRAVREEFSERLLETFRERQDL